jgi:hypothetical protein
MTKKIDEAVSLNISNSNGDMTSNTTITAADIPELAQVLKNAGIAGNSAAFNGPATLTVDVQEGGATMTSTINSPDLRSIMNLLEPQFAAMSYSDGDDDHMVDPIDPNGPEAASKEVDMGSDLVDPKIGEEANYDYRTNETDPQEYAGIASRTVVQPDTKRVPARSGDNPLSEGPFEDKLKTKFPDTEEGAIAFLDFMSTHDMDGATAKPDSMVDGVWLVTHKGGKSIVYLNDMDFEDVDVSEQVTESPYKPGGSEEFDTWIEDETHPQGEVEVTVHYDWDSGDFDTGLDHMPVASMGGTLDLTAVVVKSTGEDIIDRIDQKTMDRIRQEAVDHSTNQFHQEESVSPKSFRDYVEEASKKSNNPKFGYGIYGVGYFGHNREEDHGEDTSAELGFDMGGDFGESQTASDETELNELSGDLKGRYAAKARDSKAHHEKKAGDLDDLVHDAEEAERMGIMRKGAGKRVAKWRNAHDRIAWKREKGLDRLEPTAESLLDEFKNSDLDEVQLYYSKSPHTKYGEPFYLNTDCGYASLEDIKNGTAQYFDDMSSGSSRAGVTVLEIDRNGKKGLNYVTGLSRTPNGTPVTCVTQTSTGSKYRPGKVIASFTSLDLINNYEMVVDMMSKHGVSPTKKLSVKTFD